MKTITFFENIEANLTRDVGVDNNFSPIDESLFIHTGVFEESEHGEYELCTVQKGSRVFVGIKPNGSIYMTDTKSSRTQHSQLQLSDFNLPPNTKFVKSMKPVPGKTAIFSY